MMLVCVACNPCDGLEAQPAFCQHRRDRLPDARDIDDENGVTVIQWFVVARARDVIRDLRVIEPRFQPVRRAEDMRGFRKALLPRPLVPFLQR